MNIYKGLNYGKKKKKKKKNIYIYIYSPVFSKALKIVFSLFWENIFIWT